MKLFESKQGLRGAMGPVVTVGILLVLIAMGATALLPAVQLEADDFKMTKKTEPKQAPEPTTMAVTPRAPSSTSRASHGRGSS